MKLCLIALLLALACSPAPGPVAPVPDPPDPAPVDGTDCEAAGLRLEQLQCRDRDGAPYWQTPGGTPFAEACERAPADGRDWNPRAISCITSCGQLDAAQRGELDPCQD